MHNTPFLPLDLGEERGMAFSAGIRGTREC
jgi:hypothetical protein